MIVLNNDDLDVLHRVFSNQAPDADKLRQLQKKVFRHVTAKEFLMLLVEGKSYE